MEERAFPDDAAARNRAHDEEETEKVQESSTSVLKATSS
jgi:hypothetical protein